MKNKEHKVTIIDTGGSIDRPTANALARVIERFYQDENNRRAFEEYLAERRHELRSENNAGKQTGVRQ